MLRLIGLIILFAVSIVFIVFNLDNRCDISFGFRTVNNIPVFLTVFASFVVGMVFSLLLGFSFKKKKPGQAAAVKKGKKPPVKKGKTETPAEPDKIQGQDGPYGID